MTRAAATIDARRRVGYGKGAGDRTGGSAKVAGGGGVAAIDHVPDGPAASPCVGACGLDASTGLCRGCLRTMAEIEGWPALGEAEKRRLLARLARRGAEVAP